MSDQIRERLGDYELIELIGDGAQGKVFKARKITADTGTGDHFFAVKVLRLSGEDEKKISRFRSSAAVLQKLIHPGIVQYLDVFTWHAGEWDETHCLVMEYLDGVSLHDLIRKSPRGIPWETVRKIFTTCLEGLIYARLQGIIHRDIKPSNIFILKNGDVKLIDFDIARREDGSQTSTAGWKGTFDYMAPDFVNVPNFRGDEQSDIFSLGVCLFQAMAGALPFDPLGEGAHIGYLNRWRDPAGVQPKIEAGIFRVLVNARQVITNSLNPVREQRYKTFQEMLGDLQKIEYRKLEHKGRETYELIGWLGRGGFGEVFKGRRASDGVEVAIKRLFAPEYSDRFIKEARILQKYPHPALVRYIDFVEVGGGMGDKQYFIVLEYLDGMPQHALRNRVKDGARLSAKEAVALFIQYSSALEFLHDNPKPIIHRDIKPSNLYAPPGLPERAKIFDMGVARDVTGTATSGGIPGTLDYMAPEFATAGNERGSPQSDIFALGLCFFEALTGKTVFDKLPSEMSTAWVRFQERSQPPLVLDISHDVFQKYPEIGRVVEKALQHEPKDRYASAGQMKRDLEAILKELPDESGVFPEASIPLERATEATMEAYDDSAPAAKPSESLGSAVGPAPGTSVIIDWSEKRKKDYRNRRVAIGIGAVALVAAIGAGIKWGVPAAQDFMAERQAAKRREAIKAQQAAAEQTNQAAPPVVVDLPPPPKNLPEQFHEPKATAQYLADVGAELASLREQVAGGQLRERQAEPVVEELVRQATDMPALFRRSLDAALASGREQDAAALVEEWRSAARSASLMGLSPEAHAARLQDMVTALGLHRLDAETAGLREAVPGDPNADGAVLQAEDVAARVAAMQARTWEGVSTGERDARLLAVKEQLAPVMRSALAAAGKPGDLEGMKNKAPALVGMFGDAYAERVEELREIEKNRKQFESDIDALLGSVPADISSSADFARAEQIAVKLKELSGLSVAGVPEADKVAAIARVKESLLPAMGGAVSAMRSSAILKSRMGQSIDAMKEPLLELERRYPNATALVAAQHRKAIADVEAAWRNRPLTPEPVKPVEPPPIIEPAVKPEDPNEAALLSALGSGQNTFRPVGQTVVTIPGNELLAAAEPVRKGFRVMDLQLSPKAGQDYLAAVDVFWKKTEAFSGAFEQRVQDEAWRVIHGQLSRQAEATLKGEILTRSPSQQAKIRREFLKLLTFMEDITGRVSKCPEQDVLRARVSLYFEPGFFNPALMDTKVGSDEAIESRIPWLKEKFDKIQIKRAIRSANP
jgi:serine/threonine protein kinase